MASTEKGGLQSMMTTEAWRTGSAPARVAAYGRVPDRRDALLKEKAVLIQRFSEIIRQHESWEYSGVFIDAGSSHDQLDVLLNRCRGEEVDTIITISMNTFALRRDELYRTLSELRDIGAEIIFLDEGMSTAGEGGEALLSTLASFLKPEKQPKPVTVPYGIGDEEEAAVVQRIFSLFLEGHGRTPIAAQLNDDHIPPPMIDIKKDYAAWTYCDIRRILDNPIYRDEGIITPEVWEAVSKEQTRRTGSYGRRPPAASPLRDLITCGVCGNHFTRRERGKSSIWLCKTYLRSSRAACPSRCIREDLLLSILSEVVGSVDNITVFPDGHLVISTDQTEFEKNWR